ncbi:MAG: aspartate--tRNA ligase [Gemmatimonadota bacterium]
MSERRGDGGPGVSAGMPGGGPTLSTAYRDLRCGRVDATHADTEVALAGWVHRRRDLGGLFFVDLRDRTGLVQLSFGPDWTSAEGLVLAGDLNPEDVVRVRGTVARRPEEAVNPRMATGEVEVKVSEIERLSVSEPLPILVAVPPEEPLPSEELRLRHRVLDLRRLEMARNFEVRHAATAAARAALGREGFLEVETPLLTRRTPEGARDYLVPSRLHPGRFYALPQSPQLYKQLLMVAGFDRYFQIARCLRDEDLRADRQPEFTQIDVEMSFVAEEDVFGVCERMFAHMWREAVGAELEIPFPRLTHAEAMERYGTDKPDLRVPWQLRDFTPSLTGLGFGIFDRVAESGGRVRGLVATGGAALSRARLNRCDEMAREAGAKGVVWLKRTPEGWSGPLARFLTEQAGARLEREHGVGEGDLVLLVAGEDGETSPPLDALRRRVAAELGAVDERAGGWLWVLEFPLFEPDPETGRPTPTSHPFTMPAEADEERVRDDPFSVRARAYDVVYNGTELASGSLRCHDRALQRAILETMGLSAREVTERFGFLLEAFRHGVPPHGGYAVGMDRVVALMVGAPSIRDVIAFPKTTAARGLLEGSPSRIDPEDLAELGIRTEDSGYRKDRPAGVPTDREP